MPEKPSYNVPWMLFGGRGNTNMHNGARFPRSTQAFLMKAGPPARAQPQGWATLWQWGSHGVFLVLVFAVECPAGARCLPARQGKGNALLAKQMGTAGAARMLYSLPGSPSSRQAGSCLCGPLVTALTWDHPYCPGYFFKHWWSSGRGSHGPGWAGACRASVDAFPLGHLMKAVACLQPQSIPYEEERAFPIAPCYLAPKSPIHEQGC